MAGKKYSFVFVLIRPCRLVLKELFFCILLVLTRLVRLTSIKTEDITCPCVDMNFIFEWSTRYLTCSLRSLVRYRVEHEKIKFISISEYVIVKPLIHAASINCALFLMCGEVLYLGDPNSRSEVLEVPVHRLQLCSKLPTKLWQL